MPIVELEDAEWQQVMAILATAAWRDANPLLMKIGGQLRQASVTRPQVPLAGDGASKEVRHE